MTEDSTPRKHFTTQAGQSMKKVIGNTVRPCLHAGADALFFVRLFARACNLAAAGQGNGFK